MLDEVAWLFNLRGSDIDFNPVFFAYAIITEDKAVLFVNGAQVDDGVRAHLRDEVQIKGYDEFFGYLKGLGAGLGLSKESVRALRSRIYASSLLIITFMCNWGSQQVLLGDKSSLAIAEAIGRVRLTLRVCVHAQNLHDFFSFWDMCGFR